MINSLASIGKAMNNLQIEIYKAQVDNYVRQFKFDLDVYKKQTALYEQQFNEFLAESGNASHCSLFLTGLT